MCLFGTAIPNFLNTIVIILVFMHFLETGVWKVWINRLQHTNLSGELMYMYTMNATNFKHINLLRVCACCWVQMLVQSVFSAVAYSVICSSLEKTSKYHSSVFRQER